MSGICAICGSANSLRRVRFVDFRQNRPVFNLLCEHCGMETELDHKGDLWVSEVSLGG